MCAAILPRVYIPTLHRSKMAKWRHTQGKLEKNKKCILRLKYLRSKYRLELWHDINLTYCTETHSYLGFNSANILRNRCLLAVSCGKLWIFVEFRLEVKPCVTTQSVLFVCFSTSFFFLSFSLYFIYLLLLFFFSSAIMYNVCSFV